METRPTEEDLSLCFGGQKQRFQISMAESDCHTKKQNKILHENDEAEKMDWKWAKSIFTYAKTKGEIKTTQKKTS